MAVVGGNQIVWKVWSNSSYQFEGIEHEGDNAGQTKFFSVIKHAIQ